MKTNRQNLWKILFLLFITLSSCGVDSIDPPLECSWRCTRNCTNTYTTKTRDQKPGKVQCKDQSGGSPENTIHCTFEKVNCKTPPPCIWKCNKGCGRKTSPIAQQNNPNKMENPPISEPGSVLNTEKACALGTLFRPEHEYVIESCN